MIIVLQDFLKAVHSGLNRLRTVIKVYPSLGLDMYIYRTLGEVSY